CDSWSLANAKFFFLDKPACTDYCTLSLHDALPICRPAVTASCRTGPREFRRTARVWWFPPSLLLPLCWLHHRHEHGIEGGERGEDRKSTRLNSSHVKISYAVFCLKKKTEKTMFSYL